MPGSSEETDLTDQHTQPRGQTAFDPSFLRRVEEAQLNSWPAPRTVLLDGWVLRFADGYTNRANSATPLDPCRKPFAEQLAQVVRLYSGQGQRALIRARSFDDPALLRALHDGGWTATGHSLVLGAKLGADTAVKPEVELFAAAPSDEWRRDHARLSGADPAKRDVILATLAIPCAFAGLRAAGRDSPYGACGLVGVHEEMACLHLVVTDPAQRRRGLSRRLVSALLSWARKQGAVTASLQVDQQNEPALALYAGLGFDQELFGYEYWHRSD